MPKSELVKIMCAVEETGKNSVSPSMIAMMIALNKSMKNCMIIKILPEFKAQAKRKISVFLRLISFKNRVDFYCKTGNHQQRCNANSADGKNRFVPSIRIEFSVYGIGVGAHHQ